MPLGDSITRGTGSATGAGYRGELFTLAVGDGKLISFVGSQSSGPPTVDGEPFPPDNEGHSHYAIDDGCGYMGIAELTVPAMTTYRPNIITLMIGTNDVDARIDLPDAPARLGALMDTIVATDPQVLLVVAQIIPTQTDEENERVMAFNAAIPALVAARAGAGKHVLLVDMYSAFTVDSDFATDLMYNNLHPNDLGYSLMGYAWYAAVGPFLR